MDNKEFLEDYIRFKRTVDEACDNIDRILHNKNYTIRTGQAAVAKTMIRQAFKSITHSDERVEISKEDWRIITAMIVDVVNGKRDAVQFQRQGVSLREMYTNRIFGDDIKS
jgi:hypothetical protein